MIVIEGDAIKGIVINDSKNNELTWVEVPKTIFTTARITTRISSIVIKGTAVSKANQISYVFVICSGAQVLVSGMSTDLENYVTSFGKQSIK